MHYDGRKRESVVGYKSLYEWRRKLHVHLVVPSDDERCEQMIGVDCRASFQPDELCGRARLRSRDDFHKIEGHGHDEAYAQIGLISLKVAALR